MSTQTGQLSFIEMLRETRERRGLSKAKAAADIGTSQTTYRQWERGQRPDWDRIGDIIEHTGYDPTEVLVAIWRHGTSPPNPNVVSPLSLDLGRRPETPHAGDPRYVKLREGAVRPTDRRPATHKAA